MSDNLIAEARKALEARRPREDDREVIAKALCEGTGGEWSDLDEQELAWHYRDADSVLAAGFSRAAVPDAATEARIERWMQLVGKGVEERMTAEAERDAALAAIERVAKKIEAVAGGTTTSSEAAGYRNGLLRAAQIVRAALDGGGEE